MQTTDYPQLSRQIKEWATELGFAACRISRASLPAEAQQGLSDWLAAGFTERVEGDGCIIPNYLTPPVHENTEYYYFTNKPESFVLFKADGDQDRPNLK